jgi:coenzyme F420 hydrogenase subunit beta
MTAQHPPTQRGLEHFALAEPAPRSLCTDCGLSRTANASVCGQACQFIRPDYETREREIHGRTRAGGDSDERFFGPFISISRARLKQPLDGAQWTGITTRIAQRLLETSTVEGVLTVTRDESDRWKPVPVLVTKAEGMAECRGMRMGYAPLLALLEPIVKRGIKRLAVVGLPCQVYALRSIEKQLGLERLYVIGTPCSDNVHTADFHKFLALLADDPDDITYLEFRADYKVELRFRDGREKLIPFLSLPISDLPPDFFPTTCRTCVDYTNALSDITVGYMGGSGDQWIIVRTERGADMLGLLGDEIVRSRAMSAGNRAGAVQGFLANTERAAGGLPLRRMPNWVRPIVSWLMPRIGPRGMEFARARVEMKAVETIVHLRRLAPRRMRWMVPNHVWALAAPYGLTRTDEEKQRETTESQEPAMAQAAE